jgi:hypothetical protein
MINQQICLKKREYTLVFKINGLLNWDGMNGKIVGYKNDKL